jgi:hypothetical protein
MTVIVGADGSAELDLGDGLKYVANIFSWRAQLKREMLRQTTLADEYERRTGGLGDWTGSFSFNLQFSDDISIAQSAWQILLYICTKQDDELKAALNLTVQRNQLANDYDIFDSTIPGTISLAGVVVIGDISLDCSDPEQPTVAVASWEADGPLTPYRSSPVSS